MDEDKKEVEEEIDNSIPITRFTGNYFYLSNKYPCICDIKYEEKGIVVLRSRFAESLYQASKIRNVEEKNKISMMFPSEAIEYIRNYKKNNLVNCFEENWDNIKFKIMFNIFNIIKAKFDCNKDLVEKLIATGEREIVPEAYSTDDNFYWYSGNKNILGKILMSIRKQYKDNLTKKEYYFYDEGIRLQDYLQDYLLNNKKKGTLKWTMLI